jgi:2,4-dienoyl-CoA reductase-like NADH-dependent reductase (Old Yellow Enzyme family)
MTRTTRREFLEIGAAGAAGVALAPLAAERVAAYGADDAARSAIFSGSRIAGLELDNRLVRASTAEGASPDGRMSEAGLKIYRDLAAGGIGLILSGHMVAVRGGDAHANQTHIHDDGYLPALRRIADAVHDTAPGCPIVAEISHGGRAGITDPVAPSEVPSRGSAKPPRVLSAAEIEEVVGQYAAAVKRAREAGFDGVEIHGAHGYLLASFLSQRTNHRDDRYGGSPQRRATIIREIMEQARRLVGPDYPILIKMNGNDHGTGEEAAEAFAAIAREVEKADVDAIEVSGQLPCRVDIDSPDDEAYFLEFTELVDVEVPVILTGGHRSLDHIATVLANPRVDLVGVARPVIREPGLPNRWRAREGSATAACISCNRCLRILGTEATHCVYEELLRKGEIT